MTINDKKKYFLFYPGDWLVDTQLQACSMQSQGAWIRLLCHMHESSEYGSLYSNNKPMDEKGIQNILGLGTDDKTFNDIWTELKKRGVVKLNKETGAFYSKRMMQDKKFHQKEVAKETNARTIVDNMAIITNVVNYLNEKSKKNYSVKDSKTLELINEKINAGYKEKDFKKVINIKCAAWLGDGEYDRYLRPKTLFGDNFEGYLNEKSNNPEDQPKKVYHNPYSDMK